MRKILIPAMAVVALLGCYRKASDNIKKLKGVKWSGTYAVPLVNADLALKDAVDLVSDLTGIGTYNDGLVYLAYEKKEISKYGYELVPMANQSGSHDDLLSSGEATTLVSNSTVTVQRDYNDVFATSDPVHEFDSAWMGTVNLQITFTNNYASGGTATISFPGLVKNGSTASTVIAFGPGPVTQSASIDLAGFHWDLSAGGSGYNYIRSHAQVQYNYSGSPVTGTDKFNVSFSLQNPKWDRIYGYFGNKNILSAADSLEISLFNNNLGTGSYTFSDPRFKIRATSDLGAPLSMSVNSLNGVKSSNPLITITGYTSPFSIPAVSKGNEGNSITDSILLVKGNSNIKSVTDNQYNIIAYNLDVVMNPSSKTQRNFLLSGSRINILVAMELPFYGTAVDVVLKDTSSFKLDLGDAKKYIDWITFRVHVENQMPIQVGLQGYFLDSNKALLDSLFTPFRYIAGGASVDGSGSVTQPFIDKYDETFDRARIELLYKARWLALKAMVPTSTNGGSPVAVKITKDQHLKLQLGVQSKLSINEKL